MSVKLRINITKEILEKSKNCSFNLPGSYPRNCAIANAIIDIFPDAWIEETKTISFSSQKGGDYVQDQFVYAKIELPEEVEDFINAFDDGNAESRAKMEPISFDIEVPDAVIDKISLDELKESLINHPTLELI